MSEVLPSIVEQVERTSEGAPHLHPYPAYKDSGVPWLGDVPTHWDVLPHRALFREINERNHPNEPLLSVTITRGVISQKELLINSSKKDSSNLDKSNYKLVLPGDIAYNKMRAWQGALGASQYRGIVSPAYVVVRPRQQQVPKYYHYLLRTPSFLKEAERWSYGITSDMWSLRAEDFKRIYSVLPPLAEQRAIAAFLDAHDRLTRRYIHAQQRLIKLLTEQKQALIQQAVTRGLPSTSSGQADPDVPLKDSGIAWLGKVPEHWEVKKISHSVNILRGRFSYRPRNDPSLYDGIYPFIQTGDVARAEKFITEYKQTLNEQGFQVSKMFPKGTLVMTIAANIGDLAILNFEACFPDSIVGFFPNSDLSIEYLFYLFSSMKQQFLQTAPVNTQANLNVARIGSMPLLVPPLQEQLHISHFLDSACHQIASVITAAQHQITLVREYRTRLIADVVTGKLDVRGFEVGRTSEGASHRDGALHFLKCDAPEESPVRRTSEGASHLDEYDDMDDTENGEDTEDFEEFDDQEED